MDQPVYVIKSVESVWTYFPPVASAIISII